ncbi:unnamed protein product [Soboliphyme baturini]|uniref:Protein FAR1-RELATED SEQUENCE n=1 Tax=Soboliphyme baturini TaxID=241478 RepID=A0A183IF22_9BILA|nr:unnamed protein product [Soboliphyme baturini]
MRPNNRVYGHFVEHDQCDEDCLNAKQKRSLNTWSVIGVKISNFRGDKLIQLGYKNQGIAASAGDAQKDEDQHESSIENSNKKWKQERNKSSPNVLPQQGVHSFPASTYLQGLATLPQNYSRFLSSMDCTNSAFASNHFLTTSSFELPRTSGEQLNVFDGMKHNRHDILGKKLNHMDVVVLKQLIMGYRDAAALLNRTADELEHLTPHKH